ncbi:isoprenyl transferase [Paenibacillus glycanilyticus]|uniref:isoprenyl transferase n=1 Tax=Paenibacillus glycanilyticus TaxID=126569 RepID=UPI00203D907B|nr:isoprenyl transferase [Paenibacillus glycanilyticus]MCM3629793.1 isoprenyl transferase [Paenibacillus glycanilyticus]
MNWLKLKRGVRNNLNNKIDWNDNIPKHIAIMMDGNGRWASRKGLPRSAGHYAGMQAMRKTISICHKIGIHTLTLYAFSTENWKRPKDEVEYIISLVNVFAQEKNIRDLIENNIRVDFIGDISKFPEETQQAMNSVSNQTQGNTGLQVFFAMNYGGKSDILQAVKFIVITKKSDEITEELFEQFLYTRQNPSPDLLIRTSGEKRLSNFLLWQSAYSELWFTNEMWPDFNEELLFTAILDYQNRMKRSKVL